jgi:hypothetical protein
MVKYGMQKNRFHNSRLINENLDKKQKYQTHNLDPKIVVDINKLLNSVKIEKKNEIKKKIIFFSLVILGLSIVGSVMAIIK